MLSNTTNLCEAATFGGVSVFGTEILSLETALISNYTAAAPAALRFTQPAIEKHDVTFCNVTISYTHPGQGDEIYVETWLPAEDWNGRLQAVGGGGYVAGRFEVAYANMNGALADGYATVTTDAGLGSAQTPETWALLSPGNVDLYSLQNLGSVSLKDQAEIAKSLIEAFYGRAPEYSYWNGCSAGGRQGVMLAQRYPTAYDGIAAGAPAVHWTQLQPSIYWPQQFMNMMGSFPRSCELDKIRAATVGACDSLDGVVDGIVADPQACLNSFNPFDLVGELIDCADAGDEIDISEAAAAVVNATWHGMSTASGRQSGFGFSPAADLAGTDPDSQGIGAAATNCSSGICVGQPNPSLPQWFQLFVMGDQDFNMSDLTHAEYDALVHAGMQRYSSVIGTDDPDLSEFRDAGGKMVTFHGLADNVIPHTNTETYYQAVGEHVPDVRSFYRYYEVPGMAHCFGGAAGQPESLFSQLRAWVENGTAPESTPIEVTDDEGSVQHRLLCPYPERARYDAACGDVAVEECWSCV